LEQSQVEIATEVEAKKVAFGADAVWEMLQGAEKVVVGRGRSVHEYLPAAATKEVILNEALGRSGKLRAPTLKIGNRYYIGYNDVMYKELMP
jgi:hypothetical protein